MRIANRVSRIKPSATLSISSKAKEMKANGVDVINLSAGELDFPTPDNICEAAKKAINNGFTKYSPTAGYPELKEAICEKLKRDNDLVYSPSQIIASNGAKHTLTNIFMSLLETGDEVILPVPYWVSYEEQIKMFGGRPVYIDTDDFKITTEHIEGKITPQTRIIVLNHPSNPTGAIIEKEELEKIASLCVKYDIICISDETYEQFIYDGFKHVSIASLNKDIYEKTIVVNSVSKTYAMTGWRVGYCAGPMDLIKAMNNVQSHTTSGPCSISQKAAIEALTGEQDSVEYMQSKLESRRKVMMSKLNNIPLLSCGIPKGAFYVFPNISKTGLSSIQFCERVLSEAKVAIVPGIAFGDDECVRISYAAGESEISEGMDRIKEFCEKLVK